MINLSRVNLTNNLLVASKDHVGQALCKQDSCNQAKRSHAAKRELIAISFQIGVDRILLKLFLLEKRHVFLYMVRSITHPHTQASHVSEGPKHSFRDGAGSRGLW